MVMKEAVGRGSLLVALFLVACTQGGAPTAQFTQSVTAGATSVRTSAPDLGTVTLPDAAKPLVPSPDSVTAEATGSAGDGQIRSIGNMTIMRAAHSAALLPNGKVLLAGGCTVASCEVEGQSESAELYDPRTDTFSPTGRMITARAGGQQAVGLANGKVLIAGGWSGRARTASAELYDAATGAFTATGSMTTARAGFTATRLHDGKVLIAGGSNGSALTSAELYDPVMGSFSPTGPMSMARAGHAVALLLDGRVLVTGGSDGGNNVLASAEIYDPAAGVWTATGTMTVVRHKHVAITLQDGTVLIAGGSDARDGLGQYRSAEVFDPGSNRFIMTADMHVPRFKLPDAAVLLGSGDVLIAGGDAQVEVYDPALRAFHTAGGSVGAARAFATATMLPNGDVLIAGGYDPHIMPTSGAWLYHVDS